MTGEVEERISLLAARRDFYSNLFVFAAGTYCIHRVKVRAQARRIHVSEGMTLSSVFSFIHITTGVRLKQGINR